MKQLHKFQILFYLKKGVILLLFSISFQNALFNQSLWSDPATWGGTKPIAGDHVTISEGMHVTLDEDSPNLSGLTIEGSLTFNNQDLNLTSDWIMIMGSLHIGSEFSPFTHNVTITLTATDMDQNIMGMGTRGIMVMGGQLEIHGMPPNHTWTKINTHASSGNTSLSLIQAVNWNAGDEIVLASTDYFPEGSLDSQSEKLILSSSVGQQVSLQSGLTNFHWGTLQYATNSGMSPSASNLVTPNVSPTPTVLDERAPVGNLTRNIVIQAPDDVLWNTNGFGCHIMVMRMGMTQGVAHLDGVEIRRGGQNGNLGRYPFHWHMISYDGCAASGSNCQTLDDATGQYIRNSSVNESAHRGIVIHGTNGVTVENNVLSDIRGHGIFLEDASERRNIIDGNLVIGVRNPVTPLKQHESGERGASGFWISNPDNTIVNNTAADCQTNGFWLAFTANPWGLSRRVPINPSRLTFGVFDNNTAHSNRLEGLMLDRVEIDENGTTQELQYFSTSDGQNPVAPHYSNVLRFQLARFKTWKNGARGIWDRSAAVDNFEIVSADNCGRFFAGSGGGGVIERSLVVGTSLNHMMNGLGRPTSFSDEVTPAAFATYHSGFDLQNNIVISFPAVVGEKSGTFATEDYYFRPVEKGQLRNVGNQMINSHPGVKLMAPFSYFALAGALWDPHGTWSGGVANNNYLVFDTPFYTYGLTRTVVPPGTNSGGVLVNGPFYGFNDFVVNNNNISYEDIMEINVVRMNNLFQEVGEWSVDQAVLGWGLAHMRHFSTHPTGYYQLEFPTIDEVTDVYCSVENMLTTNDYQVLAIEYSGNYVIDGVFTTSFGQPSTPGYATAPAGTYKHIYTPVANRQAVVNAPDGQVYWHDTQNDVVWIKIKGGMPQNWNDADFEPHDEELLYRLFWLRIHGTNTALPIEFVDFSSILLEDKTVKIEWSTITEINNDYFIIERSTDGQNWQKLARIEGNNHSSTQIDYFYLDKNPLVGKSYYRLKQVDFDGEFTYSSIESVNIEKAVTFELSPNPVVDQLFLSSNDDLENSQVEIVNSKGQLISKYQLTREHQFEIDVSTLRPGIYILSITTKKQISYLKFIIP